MRRYYYKVFDPNDFKSRKKDWRDGRGRKPAGSCQHGGSCAWCQADRHYGDLKLADRAKDYLKEFLEVDVNNRLGISK